mmetsp:Transcript_53250/g.111059  ORF Transcript_53250/g.111059 Transcript_53250/m.111059 type:complete len:358 (+) Transcript_53250:2172-3245(+)
MAQHADDWAAQVVLGLGTQVLLHPSHAASLRRPLQLPRAALRLGKLLVVRVVLGPAVAALLLLGRLLSTTVLGVVLPIVREARQLALDTLGLLLRLLLLLLPSGPLFLHSAESGLALGLLLLDVVLAEPLNSRTRLIRLFAAFFVRGRRFALLSIFRPGRYNSFLFKLLAVSLILRFLFFLLLAQQKPLLAQLLVSCFPELLLALLLLRSFLFVLLPLSLRLLLGFPLVFSNLCETILLLFQPALHFLQCRNLGIDFHLLGSLFLLRSVSLTTFCAIAFGLYCLSSLLSIFGVLGGFLGSKSLLSETARLVSLGLGLLQHFWFDQANVCLTGIDAQRTLWRIQQDIVAILVQTQQLS